MAFDFALVQIRDSYNKHTQKSLELGKWPREASMFALFGVSGKAAQMSNSSGLIFVL